MAVVPIGQEKPSEKIPEDGEPKKTTREDAFGGRPDECLKVPERNDLPLLAGFTIDRGGMPLPKK